MSADAALDQARKQLNALQGIMKDRDDIVTGPGSAAAVAHAQMIQILVEQLCQALRDIDREETAIDGIVKTLKAGQSPPAAVQKHYMIREVRVYEALVNAKMLGYPAGIRHDASEKEAWPVVVIELPEVGEVAWHCPPYTKAFSGYTTEEKYARLRAYVAKYEERE